jgi:hypothetical protein
MEAHLSEFGESFIKRVRDNSIFVFEGIISGHMKDSESKALHERLKEMSDEEVALLRKFAYKMVDLTIHNTLFFFEQSIGKWKISNQERQIGDLANISDGFSGELYTEDGWIKKYSRYNSSL